MGYARQPQYPHEQFSANVSSMRVGYPDPQAAAFDVLVRATSRGTDEAEATQPRDQVAPRNCPDP
jgi:hypothetical protein